MFRKSRINFILLGLGIFASCLHEPYDVNWNPAGCTSLPISIRLSISSAVILCGSELELVRIISGWTIAGCQGLGPWNIRQDFPDFLRSCFVTYSICCVELYTPYVGLIHCKVSLGLKKLRDNLSEPDLAWFIQHTF